MSLYDLYSEYRDPRLTPQEQRYLDEPPTRNSGGLSPETAAHIAIAMERAERQFAGYPPMPEDPDVSIRFPGVDPVGKYSIIDMKFAQRQDRVDAALQTCTPETQTLVRSLKQALMENPKFRQTVQDMQQSAWRHRTLTRASKLCLDGEGRRLLHRQARSLEAGDAVLHYDLLLQGMEYAAGVRQGPLPSDTAQYYAQQLQFSLPRRVLEGVTAYQLPGKLNVDFPDFEHRLLQVQFSDPRNWGKPASQLDPSSLNLDALLLPYAAATADRTLSAAFRGREGDSLSRAGLIRTDGLTLRERMGTDLFVDSTPQQVREYTAQCVSAALMSGRPTTVQLPGGKEPIPLTPSGYQPAPEKKALCAAWERHCAKQGFAPAPAAPSLQSKTPPQPKGMTR